MLISLIPHPAQTRGDHRPRSKAVCKRRGKGKGTGKGKEKGKYNGKWKRKGKESLEKNNDLRKKWVR